MRRGSIFEVLFISVILLVMIMCNFISYEIVDRVYDNTPDNMINKSILELGKTGIVNYGLSTPVVAVIFAAGAILLAAMLRSNPILLILSVFLWMIILLILGQLSNTFILFLEYMSVEAQAALIVPSSLGSNLPMYGLIVGMLILIVMHRSYQGTGAAI
jgi:hypothetical protein